MANPYEYIFFESDQVLTDNDLNKTFSYLDQQTRWTRNKLIGIGIVCGLDIEHNSNTIEISKGCGVTSQGYLITQPDKSYEYYMPYAAPGQLADPPLFDYPDSSMPFYKVYSENKKIYLLLTEDEFEKLDTDDQITAQPLANLKAAFFNDYVVVLFLEATQTDLKNCDMFDCNNNGLNIGFIIRPLLVAKKDLPGASVIKNSTGIKSISIDHQIYFKRFNVPFTNLKTSDDIVNAFSKLVDDFTLTRVANAYIYSYEKYKLLFNDDENPFSDLFKQLQIQRENILKTNRIFIQYFYDFVDDLVKAYYEFIVKVSEIVSLCCPDENLFPLHLVLGEAAVSTASYTKDAYRQYFIYSPIFEKNYGEVSEAVFLFERMKLMVRDFTIISPKIFSGATIKITPSQYEHPWLSQRAIPYYYNINESGSELYKAWSYYKTTHGNAAYNQSYNADLYSTNDAVLNPLLYDIEYNNFFRVEGHIGKDYTTALKDIAGKIQDFNLPIDVVAIQAGGDTTTVSANEPQCNFQDLDSAFNVVRNDLYCLLGKLMCYVASQPYTFSIIVIPPVIFGDVSGTITTGTKTRTAPAQAVPADDKRAIKATDEKIELDSASATPKAQAANTDFTKADSLLLSNDFATANTLFLNVFFYIKGTFLKQQVCYKTFATNSVGVYYVNHLPSGTYFFSNFDASNLSNNFLTVVDLIEEIISSLYFTSLSTVDVDTVSSKIASLQNYLLKFNDFLLQYEQSKKTTTYFTDYQEAIDLFDEIAHSCYAEKFSTLKDEYTARVARLKQQMLFSTYFDQHRGMEHKAGVSKGGTFIIVYNAPAAQASTTTTGTRTSSTTTRGFAAAEEKSSLSASSQRSKTINSITDNKLAQSDDDKKREALKQRLELSFGDVIAADPAFVDRFIGTLSTGTTAVAAIPVIPDNVIIADFFVPYTCCSDCAPVTYVLPAENKAVFDIQPRTFLFDDAHNYPFTTGKDVTPADFNDTTNPGKLNLITEDDKLALHPAMDIAATMQTTLTYKDIVLDITIIKPDASFIVNAQTIASGEIMISLTAKNIDAKTYEWLVNEKEDLFESKAVPAALPLSVLRRATDSNDFAIQLTVTYELNDTISDDAKTGLLTADIIKKNADKGPFEPEYSKKVITKDIPTRKTDPVPDTPTKPVKDTRTTPVIPAKDDTPKTRDTTKPVTKKDRPVVPAKDDTTKTRDTTEPVTKKDTPVVPAKDDTTKTRDTTEPVTKKEIPVTGKTIESKATTSSEKIIKRSVTAPATKAIKASTVTPKKPNKK